MLVHARIGETVAGEKEAQDAQERQLREAVWGEYDDLFDDIYGTYVVSSETVGVFQPYQAIGWIDNSKTSSDLRNNALRGAGFWPMFFSFSSCFLS